MKSLLSLCLDNLIHAPKDNLSQLQQFYFPKRISLRIGSIQTLQEISKVSQFVTTYNPTKKEDILVSGSIQSGKTNEMLFYCWWSIFICRRKVVFVCRNIRADKSQLMKRIDDFNTRFIQNKRFYIKTTIPESKKIGIIPILSNHHQVKSIYEKIKEQDYNLCIDEADLCVKSRNGKDGFRLEEFFRHLERRSQHQVSCTATEFAIISVKKTLTKVLQMERPSNYYGMDRINRVYVPRQPLKDRTNSATDANIKLIYDRLFQERDRFFILHSSSKIKIVHRLIFNRLKSEYPKLTIITYNGDFTYIHVGVEEEFDNLFGTVSKQCRKVYPENRIIRLTRKIQLGEILSELKDHKYISIISGHLASRGLSFVSNDYKLHLTDQYYYPSDSAHGETLLQGLRLFGCYNDNPTLTLWITHQNWKLIREQYKILKKYINGVKNKDNVIENLSKVKTIFPRKHFSRPSINRGVSGITTKDGYMQLQISQTYDYNEE